MIHAIDSEEFNYKSQQIGINDVSIQYVQTGDCTEDEDNVQTITISSRNNGVGRFLNIKTDGWSFDNIDELTEIINDFKQRALCSN